MAVFCDVFFCSVGFHVSSIIDRYRIHISLLYDESKFRERLFNIGVQYKDSSTFIVK